MDEEPNERALDAWMSRLAQGDRDAFVPLCRALAPRAVRLARARIDANRADDVAQSTLMNVFTRASEFEPGRPVLPWFYAALANQIRAELRKGERRMELVPEDLPGPDLDAEHDLAERELRAAVERAVADLDGDAAEAIHALLGRGPKPKVDAATVHKRVSRAYARLRILMGGESGR